MAQTHGSRRPRSPQSKDGAQTQKHSTTRSANKKNNETSLGGVLAAARRRGGIGTVLKTLGMGKGEPALHVNVGKDYKFKGYDGTAGHRPTQRTLSVSLLGGCSSKGCPTKSEENEDRYVHGKINLEMKALERGICKEVKTVHKDVSTSATPCWAFATFDGHAGSACAQFLKDNFMGHLRQMCATRMEVGTPTSSESTASKSSPSSASSSSTCDADAEADAAAGTKGDPLGSVDGEGDESDRETPRVAIEVVLARLLTDTLSTLTRTFEREALFRGEISGACVISGLYCKGALVLANIGDCQAVYHGEVKSAPGAPVTAQTTTHDASNQAEVNRFLSAGGYMSSSGRFQGILEPSRTVGDVDVKAEAPKGCIASYPELFKVDIASEVFVREEQPSVPPFLVLGTDGIWDEASAKTVVDEVKDGIAKIQAHKRRFAVANGHRRDPSLGSTTFSDEESDSEDESEFCGSGEWAEQGMDLAERVVSLARGRYDDATALIVVFE